MPRQYSPRAQITCLVCGTVFSVIASHRDESKYCSIACFRSTISAVGEYINGKLSPECSTWRNIKTRCLNPRSTAYYLYGGRGITICDEWRDSYQAFLAHVGRKPSPSHSIDRIDVNLGYQPGNVRWSTPKEQMNNRRPKEQWTDRPKKPDHDAFRKKMLTMLEW